MKIEVTIADRGCIEIRSDNDFTNEELIDLAQKATRWLKGVKPVKEAGHFGFGKEN